MEQISGDSYARQYLGDVENTYILNESRALYVPKSEATYDQRAINTKDTSVKSPMVIQVLRDWLTVVISSLTLLLLIATVYYAHKQWRASYDAAIAAQHSVSAAKQAMELDERAWVAVATIGPVKPCGWLAISFRNSGKTAALDFRAYGAAEPLASEAKPSANDMPLPGKGIIGPDTTFVSCIGDKEESGFDWRKTSLMIHGRVTYTDVFGLPHWTKFCYLRIGSEGFRPCESGNDLDRNGTLENAGA